MFGETLGTLEVRDAVHGRIRLAAPLQRDPGHLNWIDTTGHEHGIMDMRLVRAETHPAASTRVVPLADSMRER